MIHGKRCLLAALVAATSIRAAAQDVNPTCTVPFGLQHKLTLTQQDVQALAAMQHKPVPSARTLIKGISAKSKLRASKTAVRHSSYTAADTIHFDSFEDWDGTTWAYINSSNWTRYSNCADYISEVNGECPAWMVYQTDGQIAPYATHGSMVAMVMNGYNQWSADSTVLVTPAPKQDEWIVSKLIPSKIAGYNYLSFDIAYMPYTFYYIESYENGEHTAYIDRDSLAFDVEVMISKNMRMPSNRPEDYRLMWKASDDVAPLFADLHSGDDISTNETLMGFHWHHVQIPLSEFEGSNIRVAFRYKGENGGTILLDNVRISNLLPMALYDIPQGAFYYGMSVDGYYEKSAPNTLLPAGVKTTWQSYSNSDSQAFEWTSWNKGDNNTSNSRITTQETLTAVANDFGNTMPYPTLAVRAEGGMGDSYTRGGFVKFGGNTQWEVDGTSRLYGATNCDLTKQYWTASSGSNYAFGAPSKGIWEDIIDLNKEQLTGRLCGILNLYEKPAAPYTFTQIWMPVGAFSTMTNNVKFSCDIHRAILDEEKGYIPSAEPMATTTCTAKTVKDHYRKTKFYSLNFELPQPLTVNEAIFIYIHGFEDSNVTAIAPYAQAQGHDSGKNYAYLSFQQAAGGHEVRALSTLMKNANGDGFAASSFLINTDAYFPEITVVEGDMDGDGEVTVDDITTLINYYLDSTFSAAGDLDNDGIITVSDVTSLISLYLDE